MDGRKLGRPTDHRLALFRNQVTDLLRYERIVTTEAKAKEVRGLAEKMITLAKKGDLASRRRALAFIYDKKVVRKLFDELGPRYADRPGGYTRITKLGRRQGDGAHLVQLELV
ncbi:MAG: 50S ribosomal protein L17 [Dehalococcoidia bacterium]|nr:50S ribosomal protein L17 [Dehalococcoidia bacterium]MDW8008259.1 50S ribosomal protein L17 [Chloroflexota bacterium]